jgi:Ca-activated chloride channel family protein
LFDKSKRMSDLYRKTDPGKQSLISRFLSRFMQSGHPANSYSLFAFRKTQEQILAATGNQNDVLAALDALDALKLEGSTSYLDACYFGIEKLRQSTRKKRALILFTQGGSEQSAHTFKQLNALLRENNILLYVIAVFESTSLAESGFGGSPNMSENYKNQITKQDEFDKLVTVTGGRVFFPMSASEMAEIFSRLGSELQHQYTIGIKLANTSGAGKSRRIKIKIKPPAGSSNLKIRYREEFVTD